NPISVEFSALLPSCSFELKEIGTYEIDVKSPYLFGAIPTSAIFLITNSKKKSEISVVQSVNLFSQRKNLSGERVVPVAEFTVTETGNYQFQNLNPERFREKDKLLITPKTGAKGFLLIF